MATLLQINTSLFSTEGQSSRLADEFQARWRRAHPEGRVIVRDLAAEPVPHLDAARFGAFSTPAADRSPEQQALAAYSDQLVDELRLADELVLGLPMYNFGVPSTLKAWFDHVARAGITFRYTSDGPKGLLGGRKATILATRGGRYAGTALDTQSAYVRDFLNFLGIDEVSFVYAEGLAMGDEPRQRALSEAHTSLDALVR